MFDKISTLFFVFGLTQIHGVVNSTPADFIAHFQVRLFISHVKPLISFN